MGVSGGAEVSAAGCDGEDAAASGCAGEDAAAEGEVAEVPGVSREAADCCCGEDAAAEGEVAAAVGCAVAADAQAVSRRAAVRTSGSVRFMCGSLLFGLCRTGHYVAR